MSGAQAAIILSVVVVVSPGFSVDLQAPTGVLFGAGRGSSGFFAVVDNGGSVRYRDRYRERVERWER
jgi:hypothetical protein